MPRYTHFMAIRSDPSFRLERAMTRDGYRLIAGVDEVGRGSLAGPVVASAVILPVPSRGQLRVLAGLRDSKLLTPAKRRDLFDEILHVAIAVGIGWASHHVIDREGLAAANRRAMTKAISALAVPPDALLLDAVTLPDCLIPQRAVIKADRLSFSVAAASVVAKVLRDRWMARWHHHYPLYGFDRHKGYATAHHLDVLRELGPSPLHRRSFAPLADRAS